jgi:hypothetical protein
MANIVASNVTYTEAGGNVRHLDGEPPRIQNIVTVAFGNGVLTYGTNGIPLTGNLLGMPNGVVEVALILDSTGKGTDKNDWTFDKTNITLRGYAPSTGTEFSGAPAATSLVLLVQGY